jgi:hypothetical protein
MYEMSREEIDRIMNLSDEERERAINDHRRKAEDYERGFNIGKSLADLPCPARSSDPAIRGFLDAIDRQHRTHQQNIFRVIYLTCKMWAANKKKGGGWYDARNEAAVEGSERIVKVLDDLPIPYI